jgi:hypothetical protein
MAKIILLEKPITGDNPQTGIPAYVLAAWQLCYAALWPYQKVSPYTSRRCLKFIAGYLAAGNDATTAFIAFCQRIILYNRFLAGSSATVLEYPATWLSPAYKVGYSATVDLARLMDHAGKRRPAHLEGVAALSEGYLQYVHDPMPATLSKLHTRLSQLKEYGLLQLLGLILLKQGISTKQHV